MKEKDIYKYTSPAFYIIMFLYGIGIVIYSIYKFVICSYDVIKFNCKGASLYELKNLEKYANMHIDNSKYYRKWCWKQIRKKIHKEYENND